MALYFKALLWAAFLTFPRWFTLVQLYFINILMWDCLSSWLAMSTYPHFQKSSSVPLYRWLEQGSHCSVSDIFAISIKKLPWILHLSTFPPSRIQFFEMSFMICSFAGDYLNDSIIIVFRPSVKFSSFFRSLHNHYMPHHLRGRSPYTLTSWTAST